MTSLETYINELRQERPVAVNETSYYGALRNLFNAVGDRLKPKVRYVITPKGQGAGIPDGGLYTATQLRRNADASPATTMPERGCAEVKGLKEDVKDIAESKQVQKYLERYRLVLVTNYRDFLLQGIDEQGQRVPLERYTLASSEAEFWRAAENPRKFAEEHAELFEEYLRRVMLHAAPLEKPEDVARFLASYARDAKVRVEKKADLPALQSLRAALEEALGMKFEGEKGEHFFRSTLVQTLFYGIFSAWVLWSQKQKREGRREHFEWRAASWTLRVPMISALFEQLLIPSRLEPLGLVEVLDWTGIVLNRIEDPAAFVQKFTEGHAVQYFYEPFLQEFDPELRKQLGVWYTPTEIVKYMVERVDTVLREELNVAEGLADENVYVLDPCCGTGAYLVEVLRRIERTMQERGEGATTGAQLKQAAMSRVFGFEILPAPFVVAHLQLGLLLQTLDAPLAETGAERVGVFLTNALTGWEPPKEPKTRLLFPELEEERDRAEEVKRERKILVVIGNPPYNAFAGTSPVEEHGLIEPYKEGLISKWGIKKFNLDDLYVRFFRLAERRIAEKTGRGVVCYISNYSYLSDPSFVVMRERFLQEFDALWFDSMNGDSRETGKRTPEGKPDPSVFSTEYNKQGIRVGTAIGLMVRKAERNEEPTVSYREFWGVTKRKELLDTLREDDLNAQYEQARPNSQNRFSFRPTIVAPHYLDWPRLLDLSQQQPFAGIGEDRRKALISIDRQPLEERMRMYFDADVSWETLSALNTGLTTDVPRFDARRAREILQRAEQYDPSRLVRYALRPFDIQWSYYSPVRPLWREPRPDYWEGYEIGTPALVTRFKAAKSNEQAPMACASCLCDYHMMPPNASIFPILLRPSSQKKKKPENKQHLIFSDSNEPITTLQANLSIRARDYLAALGINNPDTDADTAALVWMHALAIGYSPAYLSENADGIRGDWPRVPLPTNADDLRRSAELGRKVAALLAHDPADPSTNSPHLRGVVSSPLRAEMKVFGVVSREGGGQLKSSEGEYALRANWGFQTPKGVMPGKGRVRLRDYTEDERAAIVEGASALGLTEEEAFSRLGEKTFDVYLNERGFWRNVPARVWDYHIGGYQVIKKWLSYREREVLGRDLSTAEVNEVRDMTRRIAALLLLEPALDENYKSIKQNSYTWPASA
jgi:hypothetical protein